MRKCRHSSARISDTLYVRCPSCQDVRAHLPSFVARGCRAGRRFPDGRCPSDRSRAGHVSQRSNAGTALATYRSVPRGPHEERGGCAVAAQCVLHGGDERWRLENERRRSHVEPDFRRAEHGVGGRGGSRAVESQHPVRGQRRRVAAPRSEHRQWYVSVGRCRSLLDAPGAARRAADSAHRDRSHEPRAAVRGGARASLWSQHGAWHLSLGERGPVVRARAVQRREHGRCRRGAVAHRSEHGVRRTLGGASGTVGERGVEWTELWPVQEH